MAQIKQHIPNFCDCEQTIANFSNVEELLNIPFVKSWISNPKFSGFALSHSLNNCNHLLIATLDKGKEWWVAGYIDDIIDIDLPPWEKNKPGFIPIKKDEKNDPR